MKKDSPRIASVLVSGSSREDSRNYFRHRRGAGDIEARLTFLKECVASAQRDNCNIMVLPAGLFVVRDEQERLDLEHRILNELGESPMLVAFGIDQTKRGMARHSKTEQFENDAYPFFGYVLEDGRFLIGPFQQLGVQTEEVSAATARQISDGRSAESRVLGGKTVAIDLCGELLSGSVRNAILSLNPDLVFHPSHASVKLGGDGYRSWRPKLDDLVLRLPRTSAWAFADHVMSLSHQSEGEREPLVRKGGGLAATLISHHSVGNDVPGWMYVYA